MPSADDDTPAEVSENTQSITKEKLACDII